MILGSAMWRTIKGRAVALPFFALLLQLLVAPGAAAQTEPAFSACPSGQQRVYTGGGNTCTTHAAYSPATTTPAISQLPFAGTLASFTHSNTVSSTTYGTCAWGTVTSGFSGAGGLRLVQKCVRTGGPAFDAVSCTTDYTTQCIPIPDPCPTAGTPYTGNKNMENAFGTTAYIQNGSRVCKVVGGGGVCMTIPAGTSKGTYCPQWTYDGTEGSVASTAGTAPSETTESVCTSDDVCVSKTASNCGTVNGVYGCLGSPAAGGCLTTASGLMFCTSNATTPLTTPPAPESPTAPGTVASPIAQFVKPDGTGGIANGGTTTNVFLPGGASAPGQVGTPSGQPAEEEGDGDDPCGAPGQPKCEVKIDETGVPSNASSLNSSLAAESAARDAAEAAARSTLDGAAASNEPLGTWSPFGDRPLIPTGGCQSISVEFFNGSAKQFPGSVGCDAIDNDIKPVLAFFLYLMTGFSITYAVIRARAGQS